jgi:polyisoprenoid-binding protein YceI
MSERYRFDPSQSRLTVRAFAAGMLSALGHSPTFAVRDYHGEMRFEGGNVEGLALDLTINADSLELLDKVSEADHREIEERMRRDVLETAAYPDITYQASDVPAEPITQSEYRLNIGGRLTLHGMTHPQLVEAHLKIFQDGILLSGGCPLRLSDYRIKPVTALGGTIKLKDELDIAFDLFSRLEKP